MLEVGWEIRPTKDGRYFIVDSKGGIIAQCSSIFDAEKLMVIPELITRLADTCEIGIMGLEISSREIADLRDSEPERAFVEECLRKLKENDVWLTRSLAGDP